jgi:hypothetical protein
MPCNASYARFIFGKFFTSTIILYVLLFAQKFYFCKKWVLQQLSPAKVPEGLLAGLKPNRIIRKRTNTNCSSFHLRVFLGLSNPRDRGRLPLYLYRVMTLVKGKLRLT